MENMNEGSMQLLCLLISPRGWGALRLYSFTTTDGRLKAVQRECVWIGGDQYPKPATKTIP